MSENKKIIEKNIISNFAGQGWVFLVSMIAVPFYIRFLGMEGYGLVGFYNILRTIFNSFLDLGLSVTIKREISFYAASPQKRGQSRDLLRTLEIPYWIIGLFLCIIVWLSASFLATYWIKSESIPSSTVENVVLLMGVITFFQWPLTLYQGGLIGLEKIVLFNKINIVIATLRGIGGVLVVCFFSAPIIAFFIWQIVLSMTQVFITSHALWRNMPASIQRPRFQKDIINNVWHFALGMSGTSLFSFFINQVDKIFLSKILSLENFGYYSLATNLNDQFKMINPQIVRPFFPRFTSLISTKNKNTLKKLYHKASQLVSVAILPIAGVVFFFSRELIYLWTNDMQTAISVSPIVSLLFAGTAFSNLIDIPYNLTVAYGWVKLPFYRSFVMLVLATPMVIILSLEHGGIGAALAWALINFTQLAILPWFIHKKILVTELKQWIVFDTGIPLVTLIVTLSFFHFIFPSTVTYHFSIPRIGLVAITTFLSVGLSTKVFRTFGRKVLQKYILKEI